MKLKGFLFVAARILPTAMAASRSTQRPCARPEELNTSQVENSRRNFIGCDPSQSQDFNNSFIENGELSNPSNQSTVEAAAFTLTPHYTEVQIPPEALYKTIIYSYGWARFKWKKEENNFRPPDLYGLEIETVQLSSQQIDEEFVSYFLEEIVHQMLKDGKLVELTANVYRDGHLYAAVSITKSLEVSVAETNSINSSSTAKSSLKSRGLAIKRGSSPNSFNKTLSTTIVDEGILLVKNVEPILMQTIIHLARLGFDNRNGQLFVSRIYQSVAIPVKPAGERTVVYGADVLDALVDLAEWLYEKQHFADLFHGSKLVTSEIVEGERRIISALQIQHQM